MAKQPGSQPTIHPGKQPGWQFECYAPSLCLFCVRECVCAHTLPESRFSKPFVNLCRHWRRQQWRRRRWWHGKSGKCALKIHPHGKTHTHTPIHTAFNVVVYGLAAVRQRYGLDGCDLAADIECGNSLWRTWNDGTVVNFWMVPQILKLFFGLMLSGGVAG